MKKNLKKKKIEGKKIGIRVGEFHRGKENYLLGGCPLAC